MFLSVRKAWQRLEILVSPSSLGFPTENTLHMCVRNNIELLSCSSTLTTTPKKLTSGRWDAFFTLFIRGRLSFTLKMGLIFPSLPKYSRLLACLRYWSLYLEINLAVLSAATQIYRVSAIFQEEPRPADRHAEGCVRFHWVMPAIGSQKATSGIRAPQPSFL